MLALVAATSIVGAIPCACALDWDVRPDPGTGPDVITPGTSAEAGPDATESDAATDGTTAEASDCEPLLASVASAKALARSCQLASGQCTTTVKDECDCDVVVALASSPKTDDYLAAVAAYRASCTPACAACPQLGVPGTWLCLQSGAEIRCSP